MTALPLGLINAFLHFKVRTHRSKPTAAAYRAVAEEDAVRVQLHDLLGGVVGGDHRQLAPLGRQPPQDVVLDAEVVCHHLHQIK